MITLRNFNFPGRAVQLSSWQEGRPVGAKDLKKNDLLTSVATQLILIEKFSTKHIGGSLEGEARNDTRPESRRN